MTIAFAVALSAFNAVTLTPALSALLLDRAHHGKEPLLRLLRGGITAGAPTATCGSSRRADEVRWAVVGLFFASSA
jgi:multidrug efflux pump subunit AcrB